MVVVSRGEAISTAALSGKLNHRTTVAPRGGAYVTLSISGHLLGNVCMHGFARSDPQRRVRCVVKCGHEYIHRMLQLDNATYATQCYYCRPLIPRPSTTPHPPVQLPPHLAPRQLLLLR